MVVCQQTPRRSGVRTLTQAGNVSPEAGLQSSPVGTQLGSRGGAVLVDEASESVSALDAGSGRMHDVQLPSERIGRLEIE